MKKFILTCVLLGTIGTSQVLQSVAIPSVNSTIPIPIEIVKFDPGFNDIGRPLSYLTKVRVFAPVASFATFTITNDNDVESERILRYAFEGYELWTAPEIERFENLFGAFVPGANPFDNLHPLIVAGQFSHGPNNGYGSPFSDALGPNAHITLQPGETVVNERVEYAFFSYEITDPFLLDSLTRSADEPVGATTEWMWQKTFLYNTSMAENEEFMHYIPIKFTSGTYFDAPNNSQLMSDSFAEEITIIGEWE